MTTIEKAAQVMSHSLPTTADENKDLSECETNFLSDLEKRFPKQITEKDLAILKKLIIEDEIKIEPITKEELEEMDYWW